MALIKKVQRGQPITADMINNIIDSIRECQINAFVGGSFSRNAGGTTLSIKQQASQVVDASLALPFEFYSGGTSVSPWCGLRAGTINGVIPTNWSTTFALPQATTAGYVKYINLNCNTDGKQVTQVEIALENNPPLPPSNYPSVAPVTFSICSHLIYNGTSYRLIGPSPIVAMTREAIKVEKDTTLTFGEYPFIIYYTWIFAS